MSDLIYAQLMCLGNCGLVTITREDYEAQLSNPWARWRCPRCGEDANYDDEESEKLQGIDLI